MKHEVKATVFDYVNALWVGKADLAEFMAKASPQEAIVIEDMGEAYAISFSSIGEQERAEKAHKELYPNLYEL